MQVCVFLAAIVLCLCSRWHSSAFEPTQLTAFRGLIFQSRRPSSIVVFDDAQFLHFISPISLSHRLSYAKLTRCCVCNRPGIFISCSLIKCIKIHASWKVTAREKIFLRWFPSVNNHLCTIFTQTLLNTINKNKKIFANDFFLIRNSKNSNVK